MENYYVLTFSTTSFSIQAEEAFKENNIPGKTIPTPREISSSCGLAIRFDESLLSEVKEKLLDNKKINPQGLYHFKKDDEGKKEVEKID